MGNPDSGNPDPVDDCDPSEAPGSGRRRRGAPGRVPGRGAVTAEAFAFDDALIERLRGAVGNDSRELGPSAATTFAPAPCPSTAGTRSASAATTRRGGVLPRAGSGARVLRPVRHPGGGGAGLPGAAAVAAAVGGSGRGGVTPGRVIPPDGRVGRGTSPVLAGPPASLIPAASRVPTDSVPAHHRDACVSRSRFTDTEDRGASGSRPVVPRVATARLARGQRPPWTPGGPPRRTAERCRT